MQLIEDWEFNILLDAPKQMTLRTTGDIGTSTANVYDLFAANQIYFFGVKDKENPQIYIITQCA
jgi:hypothetical protein